MFSNGFRRFSARFQTCSDVFGSIVPVLKKHPKYFRHRPREGYELSSTAAAAAVAVTSMSFNLRFEKLTKYYCMLTKCFQAKLPQNEQAWSLSKLCFDKVTAPVCEINVDVEVDVDVDVDGYCCWSRVRSFRVLEFLGDCRNIWQREINSNQKSNQNRTGVCGGKL